MMEKLPKKLLSILCCPESKATLIQENDYLISTDAATRRRYRIENGIPIMLIEASEEMGIEEWQSVMVRNKVQAV